MGESVQFDSAAGTASGYLASPAGSADVRAGVVVIQEWWGLVPHIEDVAERFAALGYVALAPDLYHGKSTVEAEEAHHLMEGLDWARAAQELAGAVAYLRSVAGVSRVGVVGFCMGGALTVIAAADPGVDAYASFLWVPARGRCGARPDRRTGADLLRGARERLLRARRASVRPTAAKERQAGRGRRLPRRRSCLLQRHTPRGIPAGSSRRRLASHRRALRAKTRRLRNQSSSRTAIAIVMLIRLVPYGVCWVAA
jgi:dienelactone hydrolase